MKLREKAAIAVVLVWASISYAAATTCNEADQLRAAEQFVESRLCGTPFEDLDVDYAGTHGQLMEKLRSPVIAGHFNLSWDSLILAKNPVVESLARAADGSLTVSFRYHRLGVNEGGLGSNANAFRVFSRDENEADRFEVMISLQCRVISPPLARVHPARLYEELKDTYSSLKARLGSACREHDHCAVRELQLRSLEEQWPKEIRETCTLPAQQQQPREEADK